MTWEQTIEYIRTQPSFNELVEKAYLDADLVLNLERFVNSEEFNESLQVVRSNVPMARTLLDIGSGNGISAVAFALNGFTVTAVEPDPSATIGAGAIRKLIEHYRLDSLRVVESFTEELSLSDVAFDVIYARQCLHHAYDLPKFLGVLGQLAKPGTVFMSTRDHVIYNEEDKDWFLKSHPLQEFYGGENAFTLAQYRSAIEGAGFRIIAQLGHYASVINYFPMSKEERKNLVSRKQQEYKERLKEKLGVVGSLGLVANIMINLRGINEANLADESKVPGRLYTFVAIKS